jgi:hypothetical protein
MSTQGKHDENARGIHSLFKELQEEIVESMDAMLDKQLGCDSWNTLGDMAHVVFRLSELTGLQGRPEAGFSYRQRLRKFMDDSTSKEV